MTHLALGRFHSSLPHWDLSFSTPRSPVTRQANKKITVVLCALRYAIHKSAAEKKAWDVSHKNTFFPLGDYSALPSSLPLLLFFSHPEFLLRFPLEKRKGENELVNPFPATNPPTNQVITLPVNLFPGKKGGLLPEQ